MATDLTDISAKIVTMLAGITQLHGVYNEEVGKPTDGQYPFATVVFKSGDGQFGDTKRNLRRYRFLINVYVERTQAGFGNSKAEDIFLTILDSIYTLFDNNTTLDGMVKWVKVLSTEAEHVNREVGDVRLGQIEVEAVNLVDSTT